MFRRTLRLEKPIGSQPSDRANPGGAASTPRANPVIERAAARWVFWYKKTRLGEPPTETGAPCQRC